MLIRVERSKTKLNDVQNKIRHGREKINLSIYNLTKLKDNETEENKKNNGTGFFLNKEKRIKLNQKNENE